MMLRYTSNSISIQKFGNSSEENEDDILEIKNLDDTFLECAISDGATESSFSKEWAGLLVSYYNSKSFDQNHIKETIVKASESWQSITKAIELPWYAQQKAETGAFAAFLGLTINRENRTFTTVAIGDCTLFQIRKNKLFFSFPVKSIEEYGNTPNLLASNQKYQLDFEKTVSYYNGSIEQNDIIILATDALAAWIFKQKGKRTKPWNHLSKILDNNKEGFEDWLNNQRKTDEIKNDDVTVLIINFKK